MQKKTSARRTSKASSKSKASKASKSSKSVPPQAVGSAVALSDEQKQAYHATNGRLIKAQAELGIIQFDYEARKAKATEAIETAKADLASYIEALAKELQIPFSAKDQQWVFDLQGLKFSRTK